MQYFVDLSKKTLISNTFFVNFSNENTPIKLKFTHIQNVTEVELIYNIEIKGIRSTHMSMGSFYE